MIRLRLLTALVLCWTGLHAADVRAQGRTIQVRDGDIVLMPTDATITIARGTPGHVKLTAHQEGRLLVVLLDEGPRPDGIVDRYYRFELPQPFLPQYVGEGPGTFEEYETLGNQRGLRRYGIVLPQGRIYLTSSSPAGSGGAVPEHVAAFQFGGSSSGRVRATFEGAEQEALRDVATPGIRSRVELGTTGAPVGGVTAAPMPPDGPVRVGGNVRQPGKIKDVAPVMPRAARQAGVFGVVIVEVTIDAQGRVSQARILRSIPLLDQAALDAVRQWEFEPTVIDGQPRPVIMTVPVPFQ
jgi:TonB family protein